MKINLRYTLSLLSFAILQSTAQTANNIHNTQIQITEEQLDNFYYGNDEYRLTIVGDTGIEKETKEVMKLKEFDALLHLGDYDYRCLPDDYFVNILGPNRKYEFMGVVGNHDTEDQCNADEAKRYVANIYGEMTSRSNLGLQCQFSSSKFMWVCVHDNVRIIGLTPDIRGADSREAQLAFLKKHLSEATEDWKICSWHYYDRYYHTGRYQSPYNLVSGEGESFYDYCKQHGAIIMSAHDHVYARTRVMSQFSKPVIDKYDGAEGGKVVQIRNGATLNLLNGVGGNYIYIEQGEEMNYKHWQKKYARGENEVNRKKFGGLFCTFNYKGNNKKAYCELLRLNDKNPVFDSFFIYRNEDPSTIHYDDIDVQFREEKLKAYIAANNIVDTIYSNQNTNFDTPIGNYPMDENNDGEMMNTSNNNDYITDSNFGNNQNNGNNTKSNNGFNEQYKNGNKSSSSGSKLLLGGTLFSAVVIVGGIFLLHKNKNKLINHNKISKYNDVGPLSITVPDRGTSYRNNLHQNSYNSSENSY
ncbi:hypothetical protein BCR32DRAFT_268837 [Anaeromyces robustus]|uniref:Calcineurin-like phosphoesterase domain-containing protein n=1 Tax=Anaeromyces robustus TaxID=1754192 RepID=A0A1Y1X491_9FUNG|nr:hypothetical protein BCR32DRAFT_268837 [Anaeromyces robustus]|eukprot:ORX80522.1 hypothetical protein BCR32DRAFT_268837 [Anaeromyces robustus]